MLAALVLLVGLLVVGVATAYVTVVGRAFEHDAYASLRASQGASAISTVPPADEPRRAAYRERRRDGSRDPTGRRLQSVGPGNVIPLRPQPQPQPRPTDIKASPKLRMNRTGGERAGTDRRPPG